MQINDPVVENYFHNTEQIEQTLKYIADNKIDVFAGEVVNQEQWDALWGAECKARMAAYERGETKAVSVEEMLAKYK